jgi:hypothetical protein
MYQSENSLQLAKFTVGASCPLLSLAWSFSEDGHPSRTNAVATDSLEILSGQKLPKLYCLLEQADQKPPGYNDNTVTDIYAHGRSPSGIISRHGECHWATKEHIGSSTKSQAWW